MNIEHLSSVRKPVRADPHYRVYIAGLAYLDPMPWSTAVEIAGNLIRSGQLVELRPARPYHKG